MGKGSRLLSPISSCSGKRQYKGVRMRAWGSWVSEIRTPHQKTRIWLGSYATPEAAARAYDAALLCLKGSSASFNFPASLPCHSVAATVMSPKSIQRVAAAAAAAANASASTSPTLNATATSPPCSLPSPTSSTITEKLDDEEDQTWIQLGALQSPKCAGHGINPLASPWEELEEWGDLNLWSFR